MVCVISEAEKHIGIFFVPLLVRMSKKRYEIVSYDIPLWLKPVLSVTETSIYTGISANKIYEMSESEDCPFVIWIGSRRVIKRKSFEEYLERQYSI